MKKNLLPLLLVILMMSLGACRGAQSTTPEAGTPAATTTETTEAVASQLQTTPSEVVPYVQTVGSFLAIHEVGVGPEGYVSLTNFTNVPVSTAGLYLCQGKDCFALPEAVIEAGQTARVAVGDGEGLENVIAAQATIGELKPVDGEVALFASDQFDDPKALLVYLQWGSTPHALTDLAVEAGLWIATGYAPTTENATRLYRVEESGWWLFEEAKP